VATVFEDAVDAVGVADLLGEQAGALGQLPGNVGRDAARIKLLIRSFL
jgi:hypothetical protein